MQQIRWGLIASTILCLAPLLRLQAATPAADYQPDPKAVQRYSSAPGLTPSTVRVRTPAKPGATPGYLLMAPYQGEGSPGPMRSQSGPKSPSSL